MTSAYDKFVSPRKWNLALLALALTVFGGATLAITLLLGAANPPHAPTLVYDTRDADELRPAGSDGDIRLYALPTLTERAPLTIVAEAANSGAADSAWGLSMQMCDHYGDCQPYSVLIDNQGYVVSQWGGHPPEHAQFPHVRRGETNRLYVHYSREDGSLTFRINDEIFRRGYFFVTTTPSQAVTTYGDPQIAWESIKIYTGG